MKIKREVNKREILLCNPICNMGPQWSESLGFGRIAKEGFRVWVDFNKMLGVKP